MFTIHGEGTTEAEKKEKISKIPKCSKLSRKGSLINNQVPRTHMMGHIEFVKNLLVLQALSVKRRIPSQGFEQGISRAFLILVSLWKPLRSIFGCMRKSFGKPLVSPNICPRHQNECPRILRECAEREWSFSQTKLLRHLPVLPEPVGTQFWGF